MNRADYRYHDWLVSQIRLPDNGKTYSELLWRMHNTEFVWTILELNDDNRLKDGLDLQHEWSRTAKLSHEGCSFLEVLVGLSRRVAFQTSGKPDLWAWRLIKNLGLNKMSDVLLPRQLAEIDEVLAGVIWRSYENDGSGGFFPLKDPKEDQTRVEIWYQMMAFVMESQHL